MSKSIISKELLRLLPEHRKKEKRTLTLTLDELIDDYRKLHEMPASEMDFLMMAYRFEHPFQKYRGRFLKGKKVKPEELLDLWRLAFASLLTRKEENLPQITHAWVEASKEYFGDFTASLTNAFCRSVLRDKEDLLKECSTNIDLVLGPTLAKRWAKNADIKKRFAAKILQRPESGINALNAEGNYSLSTKKEFSSELHLALNDSSYAWAKEVESRIREKFTKNSKLKILDACAAPGGKLIALFTLLKNDYQLEAVAVEAKFKRMERLKENLKAWNLQTEVKCLLHDWSKPVDLPSFHVVIADLPCTGLGTLASRPDLLAKNWNDPEGNRELFLLQEQILKSALAHLAKNGVGFVSICSSDPSEVQHLNNLLSAEGRIIATSKIEAFEEISGWVIMKE
jgi:hypothetical protein